MFQIHNCATFVKVILFNSKDFYPCTKESILFRDYDIESLSGFLGVEFSQEDLNFL